MKLNENYLITSNNWFVAPDGKQYKSVWGKVTGVFDDGETLGIKTNDKSTNWYIVIGNMIIAGCQVFFVIQTDSIDFTPCRKEVEHEGKIHRYAGVDTLIYNANES